MNRDPQKYLDRDIVKHGNAKGGGRTKSFLRLNGGKILIAIVIVALVLFFQRAPESTDQQPQTQQYAEPTLAIPPAGLEVFPPTETVPPTETQNVYCDTKQNMVVMNTADGIRYALFPSENFNSNNVLYVRSLGYEPIYLTAGKIVHLGDYQVTTNGGFDLSINNVICVSYNWHEHSGKYWNENSTHNMTIEVSEKLEGGNTYHVAVTTGGNGSLSADRCYIDGYAEQLQGNAEIVLVFNGDISQMFSFNTTCFWDNENVGETVTVRTMFK